jgi:IS4 transposase
VVEVRTENIGKKSATLEIVKEEYIRFLNGGVSTKKDAPFWRLIIAKSLKTGELLYFLTNVLDLDALDITEIYRLRWDIEVFFRFLKQELNFSHFVSRSINGIKIMTYMTLIAAMLILLYRQENKLKGYKIVKIKFANELQTELIKELIAFCGGKPDLLDFFIKT